LPSTIGATVSKDIHQRLLRLKMSIKEVHGSEKMLENRRIS
jgi:hypothetical protein